MRIKTVKDIGLIIRDRRRKLGIGQQTLADRIGVSRQWIVQAEKGKPRAAAGLLLRTLRALDLEIKVQDLTPSAGKSTKEAGRRSDGGHVTGYDIDIDAVIDKARGRKR